MVGNSIDKTNFPHKLLLTNTQVSRIHKTFANGSLANTKFSKTQLSKMIQLRGFTISPSIIEGSLADLFLRGLTKKSTLVQKKF